MFTALKRIASSKNDIGDDRSAARPTSMSANLQKKFSRGVQYNMKIIIKGDKCSGKTSVFRRLQGKPLEEGYKPTEEIQVAHVQWNYKNIDEVVKVEVWDVVDKGRKISFNAGEPVVSLDAEFLDVYKGTNGVILVMDITKNWTFTYVQNEITKVPLNIPVLILGNRRDMGHHQQIPEDTVRYFIDSVQRPHNTAQIKYTESSFGLKYIYKFLALPFLQLQRTALLGQLDRNAEEMRIAVDEIDLFQTSEDADYSKFAGQLNLKRRKKAESLGVSLGSSNSRTPSVIFGHGCPINRYAPFRKTTQGQPVEDFHQAKVDRNCNKEAMTVEEFIPNEEKLDDQFFRDLPSSDLALTSQNECSSDSDGPEVANPLVARFQEDVDPKDQFYQYAPNLTFEKPHRNGEHSKSRETDRALSDGLDRGISQFQPESENDSFKCVRARCSYSDPKKHTEPTDAGMGGHKATKKSGKTRGGKHLEASDADPSNGTKSQTKRNKKLKKETRSSKKKSENPAVFLLKE